MKREDKRPQKRRKTWTVASWFLSWSRREFKKQAVKQVLESDTSIKEDY